LADRDEIVTYLDRELRIKEIEDESCNGLQVEGKKTVRRVGLAVDASLRTYEKAVQSNCDMIIVHHGLIWGGIKHVSGVERDHVSYLFDKQLNLYGVHLPLDVHPELGNNAQMVKILKLNNVSPFGKYHGLFIGYSGTLPTPMTTKQITEKLQAAMGGSAITLPFGKQDNRSIGIASGGAGDLFNEAVDNKLDCYVTGEPIHAHYHRALESETNVIYLGHYHSEQLGVKAVGEALKQRFGVETVYIDEPTLV
jgi:dinuclear metal center YbgI/SA1388 family protein